MAAPPDQPNRPPKKAKDPARPTRAKAARPELPPIAPALADLLNPAINRGEAGVGSQTGRRAPESRLQPPADNSRDRRNDFAEAHKARASTPGGFQERPQSGYVTKAPLGHGPGEIDPDLARALGLVDDEEPAPDDEAAAERRRLLALPRVIPMPGEGDESGVVATAQALESLLREGRPEFRARRNPRAASASLSSPTSSPRATSPRRLPSWSRA
jgi:excinuclease ABC subunit B